MVKVNLETSLGIVSVTFNSETKVAVSLSREQPLTVNRTSVEGLLQFKRNNGYWEYLPHESYLDRADTGVATSTAVKEKVTQAIAQALNQWQQVPEQVREVKAGFIQAKLEVEAAELKALQNRLSKQQALVSELQQQFDASL